MVETPAASPRKPNRRGVAAREKLLTTALALVSTGRTESVSINLVAKEAGLSWGSVQNLFGDSDGFWAAVVEKILNDGPAKWTEPVSDTVSGRVAEVVRFYGDALDSPYAVAFETIRHGLPRPRSALEETHPRTAAAFALLEETWDQSLLTFFGGLDVDQQRALSVGTVLMVALRGLRVERAFGSDTDVDQVRATLIAAMSDYLTAPARS